MLAIRQHNLISNNRPIIQAAKILCNYSGWRLGRKWGGLRVGYNRKSSCEDSMRKNRKTIRKTHCLLNLTDNFLFCT